MSEQSQENTAAYQMYPDEELIGDLTDLEDVEMDEPEEPFDRDEPPYNFQVVRIGPDQFPYGVDDVWADYCIEENGFLKFYRRQHKSAVSYRQFLFWQVRQTQLEEAPELIAIYTPGTYARCYLKDIQRYGADEFDRESTPQHAY